MNGPEKLVANRLRRQGWSVVRGGWPDFICTRAGEVKAVEVKQSNDIQSHQKKNHAALRSAGILVEVVKVEIRYNECGNAWVKVYK